MYFLFQSLYVLLKIEIQLTCHRINHQGGLCAFYISLDQPYQSLSVGP